MILKPALAAMLASGLVVPEAPKIVFPKPAIIKAENLEFSKHMLLGMPLTMGMLAGKGAPAVSLINNGVLATNSADNTTYSFNTYGIGTASSTRRVIAVFYGDNGSATGRTVSSATLGGVSATIDAQVTHSSGGSGVVAIVSATVTTGTTATLSVTFSGGMVRAAVWAVAVDNLSGTAATDTLTTTATDPLTGTIDWLNQGFVIAGAMTNANTTFTWTGVTEQVEGNFESAAASGGYLFPTSNGTAQTVSSDIASPGVRRAMAVAAYR
jgi:hypothetical protein